MRSKIVTVVVTTLAIVGLTFVTSPAPSYAGECSLGGLVCGTIKHYSPDDGLDSAIKINCSVLRAPEWNDVQVDPDKSHFLAEGESSKKYCKDTDAVYVASGQEIWCKFTTGPVYDPEYVWIRAIDSFGHTLDATGWHKIDNNFSGGLGCTKRAD